MTFLEYATTSLWAASIFVTIFGYIKPFLKKYLITFAFKAITAVKVPLQSYDFKSWLNKNIKTNSKYYHSYWGCWLPGPGLYLKKIDTIGWVLIRIIAPSSKDDGDSNVPVYADIYSIQASSTKIVEWLRTLENNNPELKTYRVHIYSETYVQMIGWKPVRAPETLIFKDDIHLKILKKVETFIESEIEYTNKGKNWTLGFCLYGDPGTGKSSVPAFVAGQTDRDLLFITPNSLLEKNFLRTVSNRARDSIFIFDDLDTILRKRPDPSNPKSNDKTAEEYYTALYNLMSLFDSSVSPNGLVFFITTNYIELLDPALLRPGRVDFQYEFKLPDLKEVGRMFQLFFPEGDTDLFLENYSNRTQTPAALSSYLNLCKSAEEAVSSFHRLDELNKRNEEEKRKLASYKKKIEELKEKRLSEEEGVEEMEEGSDRPNPESGESGRKAIAYKDLKKVRAEGSLEKQARMLQDLLKKSKRSDS